jgi:hypothetical protein
VTEPTPGGSAPAPNLWRIAVLNPFNWLRRQAAEAVVLGTADGLRAVAPEGQEPPTDLAELRALLSANVQPKALAAPRDEDEPEPTGGKKRK